MQSHQIARIQKNFPWLAVVLGNASLTFNLDELESVEVRRATQALLLEFGIEMLFSPPHNGSSFREKSTNFIVVRKNGTSASLKYKLVVEIGPFSCGAPETYRFTKGTKPMSVGEELLADTNSPPLHLIEVHKDYYSGSRTGRPKFHVIIHKNVPALK